MLSGILIIVVTLLIIHTRFELSICNTNFLTHLYANCYEKKLDCLQSACIQCCKDPKCEPHREAREALRKNKSILDGTDAITRMATKKRNSKVAKGSFHDDNIQYFGETVVIWNIREFMNVTKWREDAMRRSKRKLDDSTGTIIGRRKKQGRNDSHGTNNKPKQLRRKKFSEVCQLLLQNSLK